MNSDQRPHQTDDSVEEEVYEVEAIVGEKTVKGIKHYKVKWENYDESENTWEPEENIIDKDLIAKFHDRQPKTTPKSITKKRSDIIPLETMDLNESCLSSHNSTSQNSPYGNIIYC